MPKTDHWSSQQDQAQGRSGSAADGGFVPAPQISLPKGGGAIRGIGEKFGANPVTGTGSFTVPIATSPGRSGFTPRLELRYDSGFGNGPFGFGWRLALPEIARKTDKGTPRYRDDQPDVFTLSDAEDLVPSGASLRDGIEVRRYRPRVESDFSRIECWQLPAPGEMFWVVTARNNVTSVFGRTPQSRIADPADPARVFKWLICETFDGRGNVMSYEYAAEDGAGVDTSAPHERNRDHGSRGANRYIKRIKYGNRRPHRPHEEIDGHEWLFEVVFDYGDHDDGAPSPRPTRAWPVRPDPFSTYRSTFEIRTYRLCRRVLMFHHFPDEPTAGADCLVSSMRFEFREPGPPPARSHGQVATFLAAVRRAGHVSTTAGSSTRELPPLEFEYSTAIIDETVRTIELAQLRNLPAGLEGLSHRWVDLDGEGLPGVLTSQGSAWFYKRNLGAGRFAPTELARVTPSLAFEERASHQLLDLAGDGRLDLAVLKPEVSGFHERIGDRWTSFTPFKAVPNLSWDDPNLRMVDLDGDGFSDLLVAEGDTLTWYPSLAEDGFGDGRRIALPTDDDRGPRLVFGHPEGSVFLADMSGDGSADLVRIRNGEVCYWPNLGHGRFGRKVVMSNSPWFDTPEAFDPRRIRLADIDGSGCVDIIYVGARAIAIYANECGNAWSAPVHLDQLPETHSLASISTTDLLGNGTACLVWSSPLPGDSIAPLKYIDLMSGTKPHLLVRVVNNLGAETRIHYAPSTRFYVRDRERGIPWITSLPFPVHVVERVETLDRISRNRFVTRYAYHHGHFDGYEREFRGFGRVDQWDTEEYAIFAAETPTGFADNLDAASHVPPVLTKTWFHTGWLDDRGEIAARLASEYYRSPDEDDEAGFLLPDTILPDGLTADEARQAARALKGSMLRQEVYGLDGTAAAPRPYRVSERSHTVELIQSRGSNLHAVFFPRGHEGIDFHFERTIYEIDGTVRTDPRVNHELTLAIDAYGNVLESVNIAYGRRHPEVDPSLTDVDRETQCRTRALRTTFRYTNAVDEPGAYRTPAPCETISYELLPGIEGRPRSYRLLTPDEVRRLVDTADRQRLLEHTRTFYRSDDLSRALPRGALESHALFFESYKLALTPDILAASYGTRVSEQMLEEHARYVRLPDHPGWWVPSGRFFYSADPDDAAEAELAAAEQHFFLPRRFRDPFHAAGFSTDGIVRYDRYDLLVELTRDALGNTVSAGEREAGDSGRIVRGGLDYRVLQPFLVMDANRNRSMAAFDALGLLVGTAVMGKPEEDPASGDRLDRFVADLPDRELLAHLQDPLASPALLLQGATTRMLYDIHAYVRTKQLPQPEPVVVASLARETHGDSRDAARVQQTFTYFDGFARQVQKKVDAERDEGVPKWLGTSWTVFNNKEQPVRRYEPFFTPTHRFEFNARAGVSAIMCHDALERIVATIYPNHTWEKTSFTPWRQDTWDVNDTALEADPALDPDVGHLFGRLRREEYFPTWYMRRASGALGEDERIAAERAALHARTPGIAQLDALGREFAKTSLNRFVRAGRTRDEAHTTRAVLDAAGNQLELWDAAGRLVMRGAYDLLNNRIQLGTIDAGERWHLYDVTGQEVCGWTSRGDRVRTVRDELRRPSAVFLQREGGDELLVERTEYGEHAPDAAARNQRGRPVRTSDQSGTMSAEAYDFKGNLLSSLQRVATSYREVLDWSGDVALEPREYRTLIAYDALNRRISVRTADGSTIRPGYNIGGLLERVDVNVRGEERDGALLWTSLVSDIDYDPKGQRLRIEYANGTSTASEYDPLTFRLTRLVTIRKQGPPLQDLRYTYDPAGNITHIHDGAQPDVFFRNQRIDASSDFTYDAIYRLIEATGREHLGQAGASPSPFSHDSSERLMPAFGIDDGSALARCVERYEYDAPGNITRISHRSISSMSTGWTRTFDYAAPSGLNPEDTSGRLTATTIGDAVERYQYDAHGNTVRMPHLPSLEWDFRDRLRRIDTRRRGEDTTGTTWFVYDTAGRRVRKVTEDVNGGVARESVYAEGVEFEWPEGPDGPERTCLHVMDDRRRIALLETTTGGGAQAPVTLVRYQLSNHLGSATLELDADARVISYEEHTPFGSTALQAVRSRTESPKRYRYCGKERDEESGFYYYGARYYAPWLGRWISCDPAATGGRDWARADQSYVYVENRPVVASDPDGRIIWFVVIGAVALTTVTVVSPANAPTSATEKTYPRISNAEFAFHTGVNALSLCGGTAAGKWVFAKTESVILSSTAAGATGGFIEAPGNQLVTDAWDGDFASPGEYASITAKGTAFGAGTGFLFGVGAKGWQWLRTPATPEFRIPGRAPSGTPAEAQAWDDAGQRLDDIIRTGGPFPAETRGVGAAIIDVPGYTGATELRGFSAAATDALGEGAAVFHVQTRAPGDRIFQTYRSWRGAPGGAINRVNDVEPQLFSEIAENLPANAKGTIHFTTMRTRAGGEVLEPLPACLSCTNVTFQMAGLAPDVQIVSHAAVNPGRVLDLFPEALRPAAQQLLPYVAALFGTSSSAAATRPNE